MTAQLNTNPNTTPRVSDRRSYQREYYRQNKERLMEYQREYSRRHRRKMRAAQTAFATNRPPTKETFNICDIARACPEKAAEMINRIICGERSLTLPY